jgi:hypothetical protein
MVQACLNVLLQPFPHLRDGFHGILLEIGNPSPQGIGFAHRKEFSKEHRRTFAPCVDNFLVFEEPLFCLPHEGEGKLTEFDGIWRDIFDDDGVAKLEEVLQMHICVLACQSIE